MFGNYPVRFASTPSWEKRDGVATNHSPLPTYTNNISNMPVAAMIIAPMVSGQKNLFTIAFARSWNRHSKYATIANRPVRNTADNPKNSNAGKPINPAHIAINLYGTGVTAVKKIINTPCLINKLCANANFSIDAKCSIIQTPTESNTHNPMQYAIAPPTIEPNVAAKNTGNARFLFATIGGVINTSGGIKRNIDSNTVIMKTIHVYALLSARDNRYSEIFMVFIPRR